MCPSPHVVGFLAQFTRSENECSHLYIVMEYMDDNLYHVWQHSRGILPREHACKYLKQACAGVHHLHGLGIVHCDLSMANLLVQGSGTLKVGDLGCARFASGRLSDLGSADTQPGDSAGAQPEEFCGAQPGGLMTFDAAGQHPMGTNYIRCPELWFWDRRPSVAVDTWALGVIAVALLAGTLIFRSVTSNGVMPKIYQFLGPVVDWAEVSKMPKWKSYKAALTSPLATVPCQSRFLADAKNVRLPLQPDDNGSKFVLGILRWRPQARSTLETLLRHELFQQGSRDRVLDHALAQCSHPVLSQLLAGAVASGRPLNREEVLLEALRGQSVKDGK